MGLRSRSTRPAARPHSHTRMKVKICGITSYEDAREASAAGADMLGFNFHPESPRHVTPLAAGEIIRRLRADEIGTKTVGVFVNESAARIREIGDACALDLIQLSGDEPPTVAKALKGKAFKALRPFSLEDAEADAEWHAGVAVGEPSFLLDAYRPGAYGGTGQLGDWGIAARLSPKYQVLLAGGLTPENVAAAIARVRPWGVDVASGVESSAGKKDAGRMRAFVSAAKGVKG